MAPYIKVVVSLFFTGLGFWAFFSVSFWPGVLAFITLFVIGDVIGSVLFKRFAALDQIKQDLETRLHND